MVSYFSFSLSLPPPPLFGWRPPLVCFQVVFDAFWKYRRVSKPPAGKYSLYHSFCWALEAIWVVSVSGSMPNNFGHRRCSFKKCATFHHGRPCPQKTVLRFRIGSCVARVTNAQANAHPREREKTKNTSHRGENLSSYPRNEISANSGPKNF